MLTKIEILTIVLSLWGSIIATILMILRFIDLKKDMPDIVVRVKGGYRAIHKDTDHGDDELVIITVANKGKRIIEITSCGLLNPRYIKQPYSLFSEGIKKIKLSEGESHDYLSKEKLINISEKRYIAWAVDNIGRKYWSHSLFRRLIKTGRVK